MQMKNPDILVRVFARLGQEKELLELRDILYQTMGLVMDFINAEGTTLRLSQGRNFSAFCRCMRKNAECAKLCHACDLANAQLAAKRKRPLVYSCHAGLVEIVVPLFGHQGEYLGCLTSGQFRKAGTAASGVTPQIRDYARFTRIPERRLMEMHARCVCLEERQVKGVVRYLQMVGRLLVTVHYNLLFMESIDIPARMALIRQYIHEHYAEPLSLVKVARRFSLSPEYLCRLFKKEHGVGFNAYLNYYRVEKGRELLQSTQLYVANIVDMVGFGSVVQFNRVFRRLIGASPAQWRKQQGDKSPADPKSHATQTDLKLLQAH